MLNNFYMVVRECETLLGDTLTNYFDFGGGEFKGEVGPGRMTCCITFDKSLAEMTAKARGGQVRSYHFYRDWATEDEAKKDVVPLRDPDYTPHTGPIKNAQPDVVNIPTDKEEGKFTVAEMLAWSPNEIMERDG